MSTPTGPRQPVGPLCGPDELEAARRMLRALTARQRQVVVPIGDGARPSEVADELHVTRTTISFHLRRIRERLGLRSHRELIKVAILLARVARETGP